MSDSYLPPYDNTPKQYPNPEFPIAEQMQYQFYQQEAQRTQEETVSSMKKMYFPNAQLPSQIELEIAENGRKIKEKYDQQCKENGVDDDIGIFIIGFLSSVLTVVVCYFMYKVLFK